jgi:hypothetical protein
MAFKFNEVLGCVFMFLGWGVISIVPFLNSIVLVDYRIHGPPIESYTGKI